MSDQYTNTQARDIIYGYTGGAFAAIVITNGFDYSKQTEVTAAAIMLVVMAAILANMYYDAFDQNNEH